jgi:hypothetical protein
MGLNVLSRARCGATIPSVFVAMLAGLFSAAQAQETALKPFPEKYLVGKTPDVGATASAEVEQLLVPLGEAPPRFSFGGLKPETAEKAEAKALARAASASAKPLTESVIAPSDISVFDIEKAERAKWAEKQAASGVEKPAAYSGILATTVAPIYVGVAGNTSYLRIVNGDDFNYPTTVTVVGGPNGTVYGSATISVPPGASPQYDIYSILAAANASTLRNGDTYYTLYLRNVGDVGFQHVIYNSQNAFFENASVCTYVDGISYGTLNQVAINVHTTRIPTYPSFAFVHNYLSSNVAMAVDIYDASTGTLKGTYSGVAAPNATYALPMADLEAAIGWVPTVSQPHANILVRSSTGSTSYALVGQNILNERLSAFLNMTNFCIINY